MPFLVIQNFKMDKNTITGLVLIFGLILLWQTFFPPVPIDNQPVSENSKTSPAQDTVDKVQEIQVITPVSTSEDIPLNELEYYLENELIKVTFSNLGGKIKSIDLKNFKKSPESGSPDVILLNNVLNRFNFKIPNLQGVSLNTENLLFSSTQNNSENIQFEYVLNGKSIIQFEYLLKQGDYTIDFNIKINEESISNQLVTLQWINHLHKIETNESYERNFSTVFYKTSGEDPQNLSLTNDDEEIIDSKEIKWISHSNQFFNTSLIPKTHFSSAELKIQRLSDESPDLKRIENNISIEGQNLTDSGFDLTIYSGPNEFNRLYNLGESLQEIIPFGWSFFGTINRWVIRPMFNSLSDFVGNMGWGILFLTLLVKVLLFPLTYRMLYSQSKMGALKPKLEQLKQKFKSDPQQQQVETMKIYREHGVNPLGGCLPMLAQMPIWFALYRFFPAAIEFRQVGFLWADDLSSYDVIANLPFEIPFGFGSHLSLFTLLWAISTLIFTYFNTKDMDMSANPAMKYLQYLMPILFLGFFNSYASGLTAYLFFSNVINIGQTVITKRFFINQEKIKASLEAYKATPKKKSKFQQRLEEAMKEQQRRQSKK